MAGKTHGYGEAERRLLERRLDRARFLRLIGAGATLPFIPAALVARPSDAQTTPLPPTPADLVAGGEFPIGVWWPPPPDETNQQRYQEIADANFNFVIGGNGVTNENAIRDALDAAEDVRVASGKELKFLLTDDPGLRDNNGVGLQDLIRGETAGTRSSESAEPGVMQYMNEQDDPASAPDGTVSGLALSDLQQEIRQRVQELRVRYMEDPVLAGINLFDEPNRKWFERLKFAKTEVRNQFPDDQDLPYANVLPSYAARSMMGTRTYAEYLDLYLKVVRPPLLSFGHYPLLTGDRITDDYFSNWAAIRSRALKYRIPSWILIQSVSLEGTIISPARRRPDGDELFWQANVSLAYGAKGIQYFTYWTPESDPPRIQFRDALIAKNEAGEWDTTPLYNRAREVNEYLSAVGKELLPLTSETVMHTGVKARPGVQPFKANNYIKAVSGSPVILGKFWRIKEQPERYFLIVNRSLDTDTSTDPSRLTLTGSVTEVARFDPASGTYTVRETPEGTPLRNLSLPLEPGRAELYRLSTA